LPACLTVALLVAYPSYEFSQNEVTLAMAASALKEMMMSEPATVLIVASLTNTMPLAQGTAFLVRVQLLVVVQSVRAVRCCIGQRTRGRFSVPIPNQRV
jgi:hypothetical protein